MVGDIKLMGFVARQLNIMTVYCCIVIMCHAVSETDQAVLFQFEAWGLYFSLCHHVSEIHLADCIEA